MSWDVEYTDQFGDWWNNLNESEQARVRASVLLLEEFGMALGLPHTKSIKASRHSRMRELRVQHEGRPYRVFYAFDPRRMAILLIGGEKTGKDEKLWYEKFITVADELYDEHLEELGKEGIADG